MCADTSVISARFDRNCFIFSRHHGSVRTDFGRKHRTMSSDTLGRTILVVDDDEGVRKLLTRWVVVMGHDAKAAPDADTALEIMRNCPVDVALCDIRMPGHDGIWLVEQMSELFPAIAVVLATGLLEMDPLVTLRPGVVGYITKPFDRENLEQAVIRGLEERKRLQTDPPSPRPHDTDFLEDIALSQTDV